MGSELGITAQTKPHPVIDNVSIWWITWLVFWTLIVVSGMVYLICNRHMPSVRMRGISVSLIAVVMLHLYWMSCQIGRIIGPLAPADGEYWIMGTYFPLGVALFQASNSRFLHVAKQQRRYADGSSSESKPVTGKGLVARFKRASYTTKLVIVVGTGMAFQLFMTVFIYCISRKFHESWGIPGTEVHGTPMEQAAAAGRGWEWWPTCFWQLFWAWVVAPIILWKSRHINDTHGWRTQTIGCCIAGLPAAPMWLIAVHVDAMQVVNQYFIPPQWICLSIMFLEIFTVLLPCWEVMRQKSLSKETKESIAQWETKNRVTASGAKSLNTNSSVMESILTGKKSTTSSVDSAASNESILTMSALEYVLERNPAPLLEFSALRDFSGENIAFLTAVADWKSSLPAAARGSSTTIAEVESGSVNMRELVRERFNRALRIYAEFVSTRDAQFPINISGQDLKALEAVFESSARILYGSKRQVDSAAPFDMPAWNDSAEKSPISDDSGACLEDRVQYWGEIPDSFDGSVFDKAEESIKYLVLTNTWPKFVKDRRTSLDSNETAVESGKGGFLAMVRNRRR